MESYEWSAERVLTNQAVVSLIAAQFPVLSPVHVTARHEGWDNEAFEINGEWIFRFPKRADGELPLKRELALLPRLSTVVPLPVPAYQLIGQPCALFPCVFAGYLKLDGTPAIDLVVGLAHAVALAPSVALFLSAVHSFSWADAQDLGVPRAEVDPRTGAQGALDELKEIASALETELVSQCRSYLAPAPCNSAWNAACSGVFSP